MIVCRVLDVVDEHADAEAANRVSTSDSDSAITVDRRDAGRAYNGTGSSTYSALRAVRLPRAFSEALGLGQDGEANGQQLGSIGKHVGSISRARSVRPSVGLRDT
jgi:hypothetical protein